jgi:DNA repair exonuclease SbcCD ATPase subunit
MTIIRPIAILAGILVIIIAIILLSRREKTPKKTEVVIEVEIPTLSNYVELQRERLDLLNAVVSLDSDFEDDKIDKNQYDNAVAEHNRKLTNIEITLKRITQNISEEQELKESLRQIQQADSELSRIASDLKNLEIRLRARRISRRDYERRRKDRLRRRNTAINKIEEALDTLGD